MPGVRIFKTKGFAKFARKEGIDDAKLCAAVKDAEAGKIYANYGGSLVKQQIARPHGGKSGGYRVLILYPRGVKAFFVYGFPKNERDNITKEEERDWKALAKYLFGASDAQLGELLKKEAFLEVKSND